MKKDLFFVKNMNQFLGIILNATKVVTTNSFLGPLSRDSNK
jgi:hypothetical protein